MPVFVIAYVNEPPCSKDCRVSLKDTVLTDDRHKGRRENKGLPQSEHRKAAGITSRFIDKKKGDNLFCEILEIANKLL